MAEFTLPANSKITAGKTHPAPRGRGAQQAVPHLPLEPG